MHAPKLFLSLLLLLLSKKEFVKSQYGGFYWQYCNTPSAGSLLPADGQYAFFSYPYDLVYSENPPYKLLVNKYGPPVCRINSIFYWGGIRYEYSGWVVYDPCPAGSYAANYLYYADPSVQCVACTPKSSASLLPDNARYTANGNFRDACTQWLCNAGFYKKVIDPQNSRLDICEPCINNQYLQSSCIFWHI